MSRERVLQRRIRTLETLDEAVSALRSLSAQHFRTARAPLADVRAYRDEVQKFLAVIEPQPKGSEHAGPMGIVLVAADLGLVGDYTAQLVREALALRAESQPGPLVCLGHRAVAALRKAGVEPVSIQPSPTSVAGLTRLLLPLVDTLLSLRSRSQLDSLWLVAARFEGAGHYRPVRVPVLPISPPAETISISPSPYTVSEHIRMVVAREYLFASLYETLLEALASEHGKRLVTAESARGWLEERIGATRRRASALRRETSTQEVLEIVAAGRATRPAAGRPS